MAQAVCRLRKKEPAFACALPIEYTAAKRLGTARLVGIACKKYRPQEAVISFGFAGALRGDLPLGAVIDVVMVVDERGRVLWRGKPLGIRNSRAGVVVSTDHFVSSAEERTALRKKSGADIVDMETGILAKLGVLEGGVRVVSDTPSHYIGIMSKMIRPDGRLNWAACARLSSKELASAAFNGFIARKALYHISLAS